MDAPELTHRTIRLRLSVYHQFQELVHALELARPPDQRLQLRTSANDAVAWLLDQPAAKELVERQRVRRKL